MDNGNWTPREEAQEEEKLATHIAEHVIGQASGRLKNECLFNLPRDCYFVGNLRSAAGENDKNENRSTRDWRNKLAPVSFGAEFMACPQDDELAIGVTVKWSCYYRVFPTYQQQRDFQIPDAETDQQPATERIAQKDDAKNVEPEDDAERAARWELERDRQEAQAERRQQREKRDALCPRFRKISCQAVGNVLFRKGTDGALAIDKSKLEQALDAEVQRARQVVLEDPERLRHISGDMDGQVNIPETALTSEIEYNRFKEQPGNEIPLSWAWEVQGNCESQSNAGESGNLFISINFTNASPMPDRSSTRENFLFDTAVELRFTNGQIIPFTLELAPDGFRYDRNLWGRGFNCAVEKISETEYHTTHTPHYRQMRYLTSTEPEARFEALANDPIPVLESIRSAMHASLKQWDSSEAEYRQHFSSQWEAEFKNEFDQDKARFRDEIRCFERGLELIRNNTDIRLAFQLTNEVFRRAGEHPSPNKSKQAWRLFQIVFLVNQISGIASLVQPNSSDALEREMVDIIHFSTGGGKTEAYLGVLVFHCFFDRLRGKCAGVTAWTRFPLRLLTLQQTQRMADIIGTAELVRLGHTDPRLIGKGVTGFSVGYFVGKEGTPNELVNVSQVQRPKGEGRVNWSKAQDEKERQRWKRVVTCPSCRTNTVQVDLDEQKVRIRHRCTNKNCAFPNGFLPIYVIDNEIYRYLPSVIVGTIDKLAGLGNQRKFSLIFGQVTGYCTIHGYYKGAECCQKDCDNRHLNEKVPRGLSGPTLFIQDELHLLREGLGTFNAHYETFTQELLRQFGQTEPLKVIASSATIEAFDRQVEHLYGRTKAQARVFPAPGPTLESSFYAQTQDYPQRLFLGILPHNKTIFNATLEILQYYHETLQTLQKLPSGAPNPYKGRVQPGSSAWQKLIDNYVTSLAYFLAGRDLSSIHTDLENAVNTGLQRQGYRLLEIAEMTGSTSTSEVTRILEKVETPHPPPGEAPDTILATSMISHGVDVNRFNGMLFYGMPRQNAEYIQASSRIGRQHVGVVLMCLHPTRERDQSHYAYFTKFHEFLGQLIEPVAINRWSKFSVQRTLPGLFMGVLLQYIANRSSENNPNKFYMLDFVKKQIISDQLSESDFVPLLEAAYGVTHPNNPAEEGFRSEICRYVRLFLDQIGSAGSHELFVSNTLIPRPMLSLRDVDEAIEIELDD